MTKCNSSDLSGSDIQAIDDSPGDLRLLSGILRAAGFKVRAAYAAQFHFEEYRQAATVAGASGYILKKSMNGELIPAIRRAFEWENT